MPEKQPPAQQASCSFYKGFYRSIDVKYLESGHSYMNCDLDFGVIEEKRKAAKAITPKDLEAGSERSEQVEVAADSDNTSVNTSDYYWEEINLEDAEVPGFVDDTGKYQDIFYRNQAFICVVDLDQDPRFLVMSRVNYGENLRRFSPFLLERMINLMYRYENCAMHSYDSDIEHTVMAIIEIPMCNSTNLQLKVEPHRFINVCMGVVTCYDLDCVSIEDICEELTPNHVRAGFHVLRVRLFVPIPRRRFQCQEFGHTKQRCRGKPIFTDCEQEAHDTPCGDTSQYVFTTHTAKEPFIEHSMGQQL
uniref:Uncharacterized protein n=1 Tax=Timema poppense TaxID=170557 RepID=A0A7R9DCI7_TIMPO|nr:unnamed protein product [Timema poppensis]